MATAVAQDFNESVGRTIDYSWALGKAGYAINEAIELDYARDFIKIAYLLIGHGEEIKRADAGSSLTVSDVAALTDLTCMGHSSVEEADGAREVEQLADLHRRDVVTSRCRCGREFDTELNQAIICLTHN